MTPLGALHPGACGGAAKTHWVTTISDTGALGHNSIKGDHTTIMNKISKNNNKRAFTRKQSTKGSAGGRDGTTFNIIGTGLPRGLQPKMSPTFSIAQTVDGLANLTSSTLAEQSAGFSFNLGACAQAGNLTAVFDQYRIDLIEFWLIPRRCDNTGITNPGLLISVVDIDDQNTATVAALTEFTNSVTSSGLNGHYRVWKPHCAVDLYNGSFGGFGNVASPWIDAASTTVQHYGIKLAITATDVVLVFDTRVRLHLTFRNIH